MEQDLDFITNGDNTRDHHSKSALKDNNVYTNDYFQTRNEFE